MSRRRTEFEFQESTVEGSLQKPPTAFSEQPALQPPADEHGVNPFRNLTPLQYPSPASGNPLRAMQSEQRIAAPRDHLTRAMPPQPPALAGGAAPSDIAQPAAAPPPEVTPSTPAVAAQPAADIPLTPSRPSVSPDYDVVQVFYGTDRLATASTASGWQAVLSCYWPTACCAFASLCLAFVATSRRNLVLALLAFGGVGVSTGLAYYDTAQALAAVRRAGKEGIQYTTQRSVGGQVDRGLCAVTVPRKHSVGEVESPSLVRLEIFEDASRHIVLQKTERLADARFCELLRQRVAQSARRELFVFVHGFNVSFEDAARRTAQIHYDLEFDGAPIFFSWPAHDKFIFTYPADETNVAWSVPHLKRFLLEIVKESQARSINLIAHSMGNRALAAALREIELEMHDQARLFNQVILAAPDIDADDFRNNIAPAMRRTAQRLTLYASARDDALLASQLVHSGPRAGDAGEGLVVVDGVDTIDVTAIDSSPWGHSYYGSSDPVLHDLRALFSQAVPPRDRTWLSPAQRDGLTYWIFQPTRTAAGPGDSTR
jgi:esterase/lipase superfamily enzyme